MDQNYDITVEQLKALLENEGEINLIDVREEHEYEDDNLGGILIPLGEIPDRLDELEDMKGQEIYIQIETLPIGWNSSNNRLPNSNSNIIKIFRPSFVMVPQIFTPNGDNNNEKFAVRGQFIKNLKMTIYDRWGNVIFHDEQNGYLTLKEQGEPNAALFGWDGTMNNGNKAMEGSYAFRIEVVDTVGQITFKEGALLLAY